MASGALLIVAAALGWFAETETARELDLDLERFVAVLPLPPLLLLLTSLPNVHSRSSSATGGLGAIGFVLTVIGLLLVIGAFVLSSFLPEERQTNTLYYYLGGVPLLVGSFMFATAAWRLGAFPRGGALLLILGWLGFWVAPVVQQPPIFFVPALCLFGSGWIWLGYYLATERGPSVLTEEQLRLRGG